MHIYIYLHSRLRRVGLKIMPEPSGPVGFLCLWQLTPFWAVKFGLRTVNDRMIDARDLQNQISIHFHSLPCTSMQINAHACTPPHREQALTTVTTATWTLRRCSAQTVHEWNMVDKSVLNMAESDTEIQITNHQTFLDVVKASQMLEPFVFVVYHAPVHLTHHTEQHLVQILNNFGLQQVQGGLCYLVDMCVCIKCNVM